MRQEKLVNNLQLLISKIYKTQIWKNTLHQLKPYVESKSCQKKQKHSRPEKFNRFINVFKMCNSEIRLLNVITINLFDIPLHILFLNLRRFLADGENLYIDRWQGWETAPAEPESVCRHWTAGSTWWETDRLSWWTDELM